jgi:hypothetical protein
MNFDTGEDNNIVSDITPQIPENDHQNSSNHNSAENNKKEYKTPVIQKNISKLVQLRKASTPRLEEAPPKGQLISKCNVLLVSSNRPKNEQNYRISALASKRKSNQKSSVRESK